MTRPDFRSAASDRPRFRGSLLLGSVTIALFFGGFGLWSVVTPLASAASAPGQVRVESYRKTVQHLEGGIIREILVQEGEIVRGGQVLLRLDDVQARATTDAIASQYHALKALEARLLAERDGEDDIAFPPALEALRDNPRVAADLDGQTRMFQSRTVGLDGQVELLTQRAAQLAGETDAYQAQLLAAEEQITMVGEEIETVRDLLARGMEKRPRLLSLQRERSRLEGERGEQLGMMAKARQAIGETKLQIADLRNARLNEVATELRDVQVKLSELEDRLRAANDVSGRTDIVAPEAGRVMRMRHVTPGGVLRAGDPVLDIVPGDDRFVIEARISPLDIDSVHPGLDAEVKLTALKQRGLPILIGAVTSVSADALVDERTGASYYLAEVTLPPDQFAILGDVKLYPGMPSDVLVATGERTPFDYFVDPIRESFHKAFREE